MGGRLTRLSSESPTCSRCSGFSIEQGCYSLLEQTSCRRWFRLVGENTNDQKNDANDEYAAPASRTMRFANWLYSLLIDDFVFGLLSVLSLVISFVAYSRTESSYSFGFLSVPAGILIFRLSIALVGAVALRREKKNLSVGNGDSSCANAAVDCRRAEEDNCGLWRIVGAIAVIAFVVWVLAELNNAEWSTAAGVIFLISLFTYVPLELGGKDYWPGYFFATKALGFIILAIAALAKSFIAADGDGKAAYHSAVTLALIYVVLYSFALLLMGYIARKDDSGIRKIPKGGKGRVGIWLGWKDAEAARIGARFAIYPMLFDMILILMLIPSMDSLVKEIMKVFFSLSTVSYILKLWDALWDEKEKIEKEKGEKSSASCA